ncbi:hypothetical protein MMC19_005927 [Ptychographa xylographoides]|nr:hypothetical protein [Ptychographa xylographoides]
MVLSTTNVVVRRPDPPPPGYRIDIWTKLFTTFAAIFFGIWSILSWQASVNANTIASQAVTATTQANQLALYTLCALNLSVTSEECEAYLTNGPLPVIVTSFLPPPPPSNATAPSPSPGSSSGLTNSGQIAIGVGVSFGVLSVLGAVISVWNFRLVYPKMVPRSRIRE